MPARQARRRGGAGDRNPKGCRGHRHHRDTASPLEAQGLLVPETVGLPPVQAAAVLEQREALAELGLGVDDFGGGTLLLTSYPAVLGRRSPGGILRTVRIWG